MEDPEFAADGVLGGIAEMQVLVSGQRSLVDWVLWCPAGERLGFVGVRHVSGLGSPPSI